MKRIICLIVILTMTICFIPTFGLAKAVEFGGGDGTENNPYLIYNKTQLNNVRNHLDSHFKLMCDIEFTDDDFAYSGEFYNGKYGWQPIGDESKPFTGTFDGNGFSVENLYSRTNKENGGFFGYNNGIIKNLEIESCEISRSGCVYIGTIAGFNALGKIINCHSSGKMTITNASNISINIGGIVGYNLDGTITECHSSAAISHEYSSGITTDYVGGIVAQNFSDVSSCYYSGKLICTYSTPHISCASTIIAGGVTGYNKGSVIECYNVGSVINYDLKKTYSGGIAGKNEKSILSCYNLSNILGEFVGGIDGSTNPNSTIVGCYNNGNIEGNYVGGIAGYNYNSIMNCYNIGDLDGVYVGGITGVVKNTNSTIKNCYNICDITGYYIGGISGECNKSEIINCYYEDSISVGVGVLRNSPVDSSVKCTNNQLKEELTFVGFDFKSEWFLNDKYGYDYPQLLNNHKHMYASECDVLCYACDYSREGGHDYKILYDLVNHYKKCSVCDDTIEIEFHKYDNKCDSQCDICGLTRNIPDHTYVNACDTTCDECGMIRITEHKYTNICDFSCNICGETRIVPEHSFTNDCDTKCNICEFLRKITHVYTDNCDESCNSCGLQRVAPHEYENECDTSCDNCKASRKIIHKFGDYVSDKNATTVMDGTKTRVCAICSEKETVTDIGSKLPTIKDTSSIFKDVQNGKWYKNAVDYNYTYNFISGVKTDEFGVNVPVTRGMFITILARIAGVDTSTDANKVSTIFSDVNRDRYYTAAIRWASNNKIVNGITTTTFAPDKAIERQQLCVMIVNFAKFKGITLKAVEQQINFSDALAVGNYAKAAVVTCQRADIVNGYNESGRMLFKPQNTATRAEAAQILYKFHSDYVA